jgi:hypothetical protein
VSSRRQTSYAPLRLGSSAEDAPTIAGQAPWDVARRLRFSMTAALLLSVLLGCLLPGTTPAKASLAPVGEGLSYDAATNTVTFELIAGPFTFNGYRNGGATLLVPSKANIVIDFVNKDGTPHSAIVIAGDGAIPNAPTEPAIPRAYTNKVLEGPPQEATGLADDAGFSASSDCRLARKILGRAEVVTALTS